MMTSLVVQIPDKIQDDADAIIQSSGMTAGEVVRVVMTRIATEKTLPLDLFQPNAETVQALQDAEDGKVERTTLAGIRALIREDG